MLYSNVPSAHLLDTSIYRQSLYEYVFMLIHFKNVASEFEEIKNIIYLPSAQENVQIWMCTRRQKDISHRSSLPIKSKG